MLGVPGLWTAVHWAAPRGGAARCRTLSPRRSGWIRRAGASPGFHGVDAKSIPSARRVYEVRHYNSRSHPLPQLSITSWIAHDVCGQSPAYFTLLTSLQDSARCHNQRSNSRAVGERHRISTRSCPKKLDGQNQPKECFRESSFLFRKLAN